MIDKNLIALLGDKKKHVFIITILNVIGMLCLIFQSIFFKINTYKKMKINSTF